MFDYSSNNKSPNTIRIISKNVNRLPAFAHWDKNVAFIQALQESQGDAFLLQEMGLNWPALQPRDILWERLRKIPAAKHATGCNKHESGLDTLQWGGTAVITTRQLTPRVLLESRKPLWTLCPPLKAGKVLQD